MMPLSCRSNLAGGTGTFKGVNGSFQDPDPYVFGPNGSGTEIIGMDPGPSINIQNNF